MALSFSNRVWLCLVPLVPSILCSIFVLYHLLAQRALRKAINNHVVILILAFGLFYEVTDIAWSIHFYRVGTSLSSTLVFCRVWAFIDASVYITITLLVAWGSIERHILIFHSKWIVTKMEHFFFHYLPLAILSVYPAMFYGAMFFVVPCDVPLDYTEYLCNCYICIVSNPSVGMWDAIVHYLLPIFVIVTFSVSLLARVLYHKYRARGRIEWRNYRKMAVQLLSISAIYFFFLLPPMCLNAAYATGVSFDVGSEYFSTAMFFTYYAILFTPFVCAVSLPELRSKCRQVLHFRGRNNVRHVSATFTRREGPNAMTVATIK